jgi:3-hydroxybutyryl-CoA dehydrogenase
VPGLVLTRTLAMLVNQAVDVVGSRVASATDVGLAMEQGVNYPRDLFEWGQEVGVARVVGILDTLEDQHRDSHYRPCLLLRQLHRRRLDLRSIDAVVPS